MKTKLVLGAVSALGIVTSVYGTDSTPLALHDCGKHSCAPLAQAASPMEEMHRQMGMDGRKQTAPEYRGNGKVVAIQRRSAAGSNASPPMQIITGITLAHESIPTLNWPAMAMEFGVASPGVTKGIAPGDAVSFQFVQRGDKYVVTHLERAGR